MAAPTTKENGIRDDKKRRTLTHISSHWKWNNAKKWT